MTAKEFRHVHLYLLNAWSREESIRIYNIVDGKTIDYQYSLAEHIWNKWMSYVDSYDMVGATAHLILELDSECLQSLINRVNEYYK